MGTKKGYCYPNKATLTAVHVVVQGQHHINAAQWMNSADPINECIGHFQQLVLMNSMNMNISASSLNNSLMTHPETLLMSYWVQVYMPVSGVIFCSITTVVIAEQSEQWTLRGQTPCLTAQVCPLQCQACFCSFSGGMLDPIYIRYQLQLRWGHHIPSDSLWVLKTLGGLAGNPQWFWLHGRFWNTHADTAGRKVIPKRYSILLTQEPQSFSEAHRKIHSGS